jgi:hypothetical protein
MLFLFPLVSAGCDAVLDACINRADLFFSKRSIDADLTGPNPLI